LLLLYVRLRSLKIPLLTLLIQQPLLLLEPLNLELAGARCGGRRRLLLVGLAAAIVAPFICCLAIPRSS
jgi:hypothetical protein